MPSKTIEFEATPKFIPSHTRGDRDFQGNGPRVYVSAWLRIVNRNQLWARVYMFAKETRRDWTTVSGSADYHLWNGDNENVVSITRIISDPFSFDRYEDLNHADDHRNLPGYELVGKFVVSGDTHGNEAGIRTGVIVHFNPVEIEYEEFADGDPRKTISDLEPTPKFVPPHVSGDRDFHGNGPDINVSASISVENDTEIWARVSMDARETRSDYTVARGSTRYLIYRQDKKIIQILSDTHSSHSYRDNNHQNDPRTMSSRELVRQFIVTGDTRGNEAGSRTGVIVEFNPITFLQEV